MHACRTGSVSVQYPLDAQQPQQLPYITLTTSACHWLRMWHRFGSTYVVCYRYHALHDIQYTAVWCCNCKTKSTMLAAVLLTCRQWQRTLCTQLAFQPAPVSRGTRCCRFLDRSPELQLRRYWQALSKPKSWRHCLLRSSRSTFTLFG